MRGRIQLMVVGTVTLIISAMPSSPSTWGQADACRTDRYSCALEYVKHHDFGAAIQMLEQLLHDDPHNLKALNLLGIALTSSGDLEKANREFKLALDLDPNFYPALKNLAINELMVKEPDAARLHFQQFLAHVPEDEVANLSLAEINYRAKRCAVALPYYAKVHSRVLSDSTLLLHNAQCSLHQGQKDAAIALLNQLPTGDADKQFQAGTILAQAGEYADAAHWFGLSAAGYRDPYLAGYNQALMQVKAKNYSAAVQSIDQLLAASYQFSDLYSLLSEAYLKQGKIKESYDALRKAIQISPKDENNYVDLAAICLDYANYDLGLEITNIGLRNVPNSERLYLQRGVMRAMKGQSQESEQDFLMANKLAPEKTLPYVALGIAWMQMGEFQKAIKVLKERAGLEKTDFLISYLYGEALVRSGIEPGSEKERDATAALETSVRLNPNFVHSRTELGKLFLQEGKLDEAIHELETAAALDPADAAPAFQLVQAYRRKGDERHASEMMSRVSKLHAQERESYTAKDLKRIVREGVIPNGESNP